MSSAPIVSVVIALGALHGFILGVILWTTRRGVNIANRILAVIIAAISLNMLDALFLYHRVYLEWPHLLLLVDPTILLLGPLCLAYCRVVSGQAPFRGRRTLLHGLPAVALWAAYLPFYLQAGGVKAAQIEDFLLAPPPPFVAVNFLRYGQTLFYMLWSMRIIQRRIRSNRAEGMPPIGFWKHGPLTMIGFGVAIWLTSLLLFQARPDRFNESIVQLLAALLLFVIGYIGILAPDSLYSLRGGGAAAGKYGKSALDSADLEAIYRRLLDRMDRDAPFRSPDLSLQQLAEALGVPPHHLSQVINEKSGQNFYRFINGYRVVDARRRLGDASQAQTKLITVAFASGFNSLATFNRVFKELTGSSPSEFRRRPS